MDDQRTKSGTSYVFCPNRDATGTRPNIPGLSRPFRDGWQLCIQLRDDTIQHMKFKTNCVVDRVCNPTYNYSLQLGKI